MNTELFNNQQFTHFTNLCLSALVAMNKNMQNEPNSKTPKINVTAFTAVNYANFRHLQPRKNEPNTNPIWAKTNNEPFNHFTNEQ